MPSRLLALIASVTLLIGLGVTAAPSYACACGGGIPLGPNGTVRAIAEGPGSTAYVGGDFTHWGLQTGGLASLSADEAAVAAQFPWVEGEVKAVLPDGTGGYFIGGLFTMVGGVERENLAHIDAQAQVSDWAPRTDDAVYALALHDGDLYVGGAFVEFSDDGGQTWVHRSLIASVRATTGLLSSWAPDLTAVTPVTDYFIGDALAVRAIEVDAAAGVLYVGGSFQSVTTPMAPRNGAVAFDLAALASSSGLLTWAPNPDGPVYALLVRASTVPLAPTVLLGGHFSAVGDRLPGEARKSIAEVVAAGESLEGEAVSLRSDVTFSDGGLGWVYALAESGTDIVIGGEFDELGGVSRENLALIDSSGVLGAWHPAPSHEVLSLLVEGAGLYVGGYFQTMGGVNHLGLAYFSSTSLDTPDAWDAGLDDGVNAVVAAPSGVVVGGAFQVANAVAVDNLVKVDGYGNRDEYFSASLPDFTSVTALGLLGDSLLVAGSGLDQSGITFAATAVDAATGANPMRFVQTDRFINDIGLTDGTVIFTGDFTTVISVDSAPNPVPRSYAFSLNMADFTLTEWSPAFAGPIADMEMTEEWLYVVGNGPQSGSYIGDTPFVARVWLVEGIVDNWGVDFSNHGESVYGTALSVAEWNGALVVGGERLSSLGGSDDGASLVGIDPEEDVVLWRSEANGLNRATSLLSDPQGLYVGGSGIWSLPGQMPASRGVALLASPASLADWEMSMADVLDITRIGGHIFAGGEGEVLAGTIASSPRKYLAVVEAATVGLGGGTTGGGTTSVGTAAGNGSVTAAQASNEASRDPGNDMPANAESRGTDRVTVVFRRGQSHLTAAAKRDLRAAVSNARGRAPSRTSITLRIPSTDRNGSFARLAGARGARTRTYLQQLSLSGPIRVEVTKRPGTTGSRTATVSIASSTNG